MTRATAFFFLTFFMTAFVFVQTAAAESLVMNMKRTVTFTPADANKPPVITDEVVTFYRDFISVRTGNTERIYNFAAKTLVVFDHAAKTYMVHPIHAVPVYYERERMRRLALKIKMNEAVRESGGDAVDKVSFEDIDLDMALSTDVNTRTAYLIEQRKENGATVFSPKKDTFDLAQYKTRDGVLGNVFKKAYARYLAHEVAIHPVIENALKKESNVFSTLTYNNRDVLRKTNAQTRLELSSSSVKPDATPTMPSGYTLLYSSDAQEHALMERSLKIPPPDMEALDAKIMELIPEKKHAEAFMVASELPLMLTAAETQKHYDGVLKAGFLAAENFDKQIFFAVTRSPGSEADVAKYLEVLESYKGKVGDKDYLLDYFKAQHIRKMLAVKPDPTEADLAQSKQAQDYIIAALEANPRLVNAYLDLGGTDFQDNKIMNAFIYWDHAARISPRHETLYGIQKLKEETEKKFPEFF
jgi:hypothetical protein